MDVVLVACSPTVGRRVVGVGLCVHVSPDRGHGAQIASRHAGVSTSTLRSSPLIGMYVDTPSTLSHMTPQVIMC